MFDVTDKVLKKYNQSIRFNNTYDRLKMLALDIFEWEGLPDTLPSRVLENMLFENGEVFFFEHTIYGLICLRSHPYEFNIFHEPTSIHVNGFNFSEHKKISDGVRMLNNPLGAPMNSYILDFTKRLTEIENAIEQNIYQQKFPYIVDCDKTKELTLKNLFKQIEAGEPIIYANKKITGDQLQIYELHVPYVADKLEESRKSLESQILTFLGMDNVKDKKERLVVDEANANNEFINRNVSLMLVERQRAVDQINSRYGLNISVRLKNQNIIKTEGSLMFNGGEMNE